MTSNSFQPRGPILIVEDERDLREATAAVLEMEGYQVLQAEHGRRALEQLREHSDVALILLDLMMPIMDGHTFLIELQKLGGQVSKVPVFVLTAAHRPVVPRAKAVFTKPFDIELLLDSVRAAAA